MCQTLATIGATYNSMQKNITRPAIRSAALELIKRHGPKATDFARQRAMTLGATGSSPYHDTALLVLSAVEELSVNPDIEETN
jgi:hypothetical protein